MLLGWNIQANGWTALCSAAASGAVRTVLALLNHNADPNQEMVRRRLG